MLFNIIVLIATVCALCCGFGCKSGSKESTMTTTNYETTTVPHEEVEDGRGL